MIKSFFFTLLLLLLTFQLKAQLFSPPDSVNILKEVSVETERAINIAGSKITKIDSNVLENKYAENLSDLLSENSSIFIKSSGKGALSTASFRGTNASHTKVNWNNINLSSPVLGMVDLSQIPMIIADDITIYHGASSLNSNNNALGGLIELKSKTDWQKGLRTKLISSVGSFNSFDDFLEIKLGNNKIQSVSKVYYNYSENNYSFINNDIVNGGKEHRQNADFCKKGFEQELFYRLNYNNMISLKLWTQSSDRGVPGLTTNQSGVNNNVNRENYQMLIYSLEYINIQEKSIFEFTHGGNFQKSNYSSKNYINGQGYLNTLNSNGKSFSLYNTASYKYNLLKNTELQLRVNYNIHDVNSYEEVKGEGYDTLRHEGGITFSAYSRIINNTKLGVLFKQDFYDEKLSPFIPSFFAEYYISKNLWLKASIARNYNMPGLNDLYYTPGGNPNLLPEKGFSIDGGLQSFLSTENMTLQYELSMNYSEIKNWILWRPTAMGYWSPENIPLTIAYGFDCNIIFKLKINKISLSSTINYAYTISQNKSNSIGENDKSIGKQLPYIPKHSANVFSRIEYRNFYFSHQWNYYSKRFTTSAAEPGMLTSIYPYFMNDTGVGKILYYKDYVFNIGVKINNLFNEAYRSVLWQPMPKINYSLQLTIKFR
jgi:iron complex outermembrane receptor protein